MRDKQARRGAIVSGSGIWKHTSSYFSDKLSAAEVLSECRDERITSLGLVARNHETDPIRHCDTPILVCINWKLGD